jgi:hypothetical protein
MSGLLIEKVVSEWADPAHPNPSQSFAGKYRHVTVPHASAVGTTLAPDDLPVNEA